MKKCFMLMFLFFGIIICLEYTWLPAQNIEENLFLAGSIEKLVTLIESSLNKNDENKLEEIKNLNCELVRANQFLTSKMCNSLLDEGMQNELSGDSNKGKLCLDTAKALAEIYSMACNNSNLLNKVYSFNKWGNEEKKTYLAAIECFNEAERDKKKGNVEYAQNKYHQSLSFYRKVNYKEGEGLCILRLGDLYFRFSEYKKARQTYEEGLSIFQKIYERLGEAKSLRSLGDVHLRLSEYDKAFQYYEDGLKIFTEINVRLGEANCNKGLGRVSLELANYENAKLYYDKVVETFHKLGNHLGEANTLIDLGDLYLQLSKYEEASCRYNNAWDIFSKENDSLGKVKSLNGIGHVHLQLSRYEKALDYYCQGLNIIQGKVSLIPPIVKANCEESTGNVLFLLSKYELSQQHLKEAFDIYKKIENRSGEANCLLSLGDVKLRLTEYSIALQYYEESLNIFHDLKARLGEAKSLQGLGNVHLQLAEYEKAEDYYQKAIKLQGQINDQEGLLWSYYGLGRIYEIMEDYQKAEEYYKNSINIIETLWSGIKFERYKADFLDTKMPPYEAIIDLYFKLSRFEDSFNYVQRSKSRAFIYLIGNKRIDPRSGYTEKLLDEEKKIREQIVELTLKIRDIENKKIKKKQEEKEKFKRDLCSLKRKHIDIIDRIKLSSPDYASFISVEPLSIEQIQCIIKSMGDTLLIEYYTTERATYIWILDGENIHSIKSDINRQNLQEKIVDFRKYLTNRESNIDLLSECAQALYDILFKPIAEHIKPNSKIGIIPHSSLHLLPFAALMNDDKFLIEQGIKIFYLPNATSLKYCQDMNSMKKENLIVLGTTDFVDEITCIIWCYLNRMIEPLLYRSTTESLAIHCSKDADIFHFSCHGIFDEKDPMFSSLKLEPDSQNDGNLEVNEIFDMQLKPAYLVTLSACQSNMGKITHSDEIVGMTRAFLYARSSAVLSSLWDVNILATEYTMKYFYNELKKNGKDKIDAFHDACQTYIKETRQRHPYFWAPFVLTGDPR